MLRYQELSESGWEKAVIIVLVDRGVPAQPQAEYELRYKGYRIGRFFAEVVADDKLLLELKVEDHLLPIDVAQVLTYLKVTGSWAHPGQLRQERRGDPACAELLDQTSCRRCANQGQSVGGPAVVR